MMSKFGYTFNVIVFLGHPGRCVRPVLLDPFDVHDTTCPVTSRGSRRGTSGCDDQCTRSRGREEICDVLPVGRLHTLLSGQLTLKMRGS